MRTCVLVAAVLALALACVPVQAEESAEDMVRELVENFDMVRGWVGEQADAFVGGGGPKALSGGAVELEFEIAGISGPVTVTTALSEYSLNSSHSAHSSSDAGQEMEEYSIDATGSIAGVDGGWLVQCSGEIQVMLTSSSGDAQEIEESNLEFNASGVFKKGVARVLVKQGEVAFTLRVSPVSAEEAPEEDAPRAEALPPPAVEEGLPDPAQ